jgi:hypothetical protein
MLLHKCFEEAFGKPVAEVARQSAEQCQHDRLLAGAAPAQKLGSRECYATA